ncbi:MAG: hypothetical protein ACFCUM_00970 [Bacteroidales bacterium]
MVSNGMLFLTITGRNGNPGGVNKNFDFPNGFYDLRRNPGERYDHIEFYPEIAEKLKEIAI